MITPSLLRTRVARRILALFLLCAMLPVATFALLGYTIIANRLEEDAREQLRQGSKTAGLVLYDRLQMMSRELERLSKSPRTRDSASVFRGLFAEDPDGRTTVISGRLVPLPRLTTRQTAHLLNGSPVLLTTRDSGVTTLLLGVADQRGAGPTRLWGTVSMEALIGQEEGLSPAPPGTELCLMDVAGQPVLCPSTGAARAAIDRTMTPAEQLEWQRSDSTFLMGRWELFLGNGFSSPSWTVALSIPSNAIFAPLNAFRRVSLLSAVLAGLLVFFLSHAQLRKRMTPLAELESGVRRISAGDFSVPVAIHSNDEFEILADSFNGMAGDLKRQFSTLQALHVVDLAALEAHSAEAIAVAVLAWAPDLLDADQASVAFIDHQDTNRWISLGQRREGGPMTRTIIRPSPEEMHELAAHPKQLRIKAGERVPSYAVLPGLSGDSERVVFAIRHDQRIRAVLAVGRQDAAPFGTAAISLGRQVADRLAVGLSNVALMGELSALSEGSMLALARTIDANSPWTAGHSERVTKGAMEIGRRMGLDGPSIDRLRRGGLLHDIGKIGIPAAILNFPGPLTAEQRTVIQSHPGIGAGIIRPIAAFQDIIPLVLYHHELLDGSGYPEGLIGDAIPEMVRILTVADIFDALVSDRPYRAGLSLKEALRLLQDGAGRRFDARAVDALATAVAEGWSSVASEQRYLPQREDLLHLEMAT